jgi:hypothetical protein
MTLASIPAGASTLAIDAAGPALGNASIGAVNIYVGDNVTLSVDALDTGNLLM